MGGPLRTLTESTLPSGEIVISADTVPPISSVLARGGTTGWTLLIRFYSAICGSIRWGELAANEQHVTSSRNSDFISMAGIERNFGRIAPCRVRSCQALIIRLF